MSNIVTFPNSLRTFTKSKKWFFTVFLGDIEGVGWSSNIQSSSLVEILEVDSGKFYWYWTSKIAIGEKLYKKPSWLYLQALIPFSSLIRIMRHLFHNNFNVDGPSASLQRLRLLSSNQQIMKIIWLLLSNKLVNPKLKMKQTTTTRITLHLHPY